VLLKKERILQKDPKATFGAEKQTCLSATQLLGNYCLPMTRVVEATPA